MPEQWSKLLTKSAITREDYARDPQAVLDVLEFYTDHQKREMEEMGGVLVSRGSNITNGTGSSLSPYSMSETTGPPARFNAGTGLGGLAKMTSSSTLPGDSRPQIKRQESAPVGINGDGISVSPPGLSIPRDINGAAQMLPSAARGPLPQASRPAPPRPLLTSTRPAPSAPVTKPETLPSSADLRSRQKAQGPMPPPVDPSKTPPHRKDSLPSEKTAAAVASAQNAQREQIQKDRERERERQQQQRQQLQQQQLQQQQLLQSQQQQPSSQHDQQESIEGEEKLQRPPMQQAPAKSSPASSLPVTQPASGPAGSTVGPAPVRPLQPKAKPLVTVQAPEKEKGGVAAAAAALEKPKEEKPKEKEKRISTMTEVQIMEKLRQVVAADDPKTLYSKIKKVGQG
jgi:hypothetical protein